MLVLQHLVFPSRDFDPVLTAFARVKGASNFATDISELILNPKTRVDFNTYFNGFSIEKWRKYTDIGSVKLHLEVKGDFTLLLFNDYRTANKNARKEIEKIECLQPSKEVTYESEEGVIAESVPTDDYYAVDVEIPDQIEKGMVSCSLVCGEGTVYLKSGYFYTEQEVTDFPDVSFAVDICTFRREKFVKRNMKLMEETVFAEDSPLKDKFEIFISDNGKSLELPEDTNERIHVFPNKNAGGAGGFGRAMIEILRSPNFKNFTHIIMMDDDIVFSYETLYRTYMMALTLKEEHANAFIGGAMLRLNNPKIQSEAFDLWSVTQSAPVKYQYDTTDLSFVLKNEIEDKGNYFGWWYCTMPIGVVKANNLPLPIFIKRDDIEYGIRNGRTFINLNGICVLHEEFGNKRQGYLEYYYWRNMCILNSIHFPSYSKEKLKEQMRTIMRDNLLRYRYNDANLAFRGIEDFLRGVDWLKSVDAEQLNNYVMTYTYKAESAEKLNVAFAHGLYEKNIKNEAAIKKSVMKKRGKTLYRKVLRGWLHTEIDKRYVQMNNPPLYMFYGAKTVINYDEETNKAFVTQRSYRQAYNLYRNYKKICDLIDKKFDAVKQEYKIRYSELINLNFWDSYLGLDGTVQEEMDFATDTCIRSEETIKAQKQKNKVRKRDAKHLRRVHLRRLMQYCLFWLPINRKRISFYLHERKGYTCNLKYIAEELRKQYGDQAEIIWITRYPEACAELGNKGFKIVKLGSFKHIFYQFTSKVIVVNDAFTEPVLIRPSQFTINTWHAGMNYKKIGPAYSTFRNDIAEKLFKIRNKQPKFYMAGSQYFIDDTSKSFGFKKSIFHPTGMARNDIFFRDNTELAVAVKRRYALSEDCKLLLYAPTFRDGFANDIFGLDMKRVLRVLTERFGGEWKLLYRKHYFINSKDVILDKDVIDVSDYADMNELLAVSDVLISDYSSCLWDFSLTGRPSFVYATDIDYYRLKDRDFSYPLEKWPFPIAKDNDELEALVMDFDEEDYKSKVAAHLADGGSFDDGHASERAVEVIAKKMKLKNKRA